MAKANKLTSREQEALDLLLQGLRNKAIAKQMNPPLSDGSLRNLLTKVYEKTGYTNRAELISHLK